MGKKPDIHEHKAANALYYCECGAIRQGEDGDWETGKDPAAVALGLKAVAMTTPEERKVNSAQGGHMRWKGSDPVKRREFMRQIASQPRPNARKEDRCECGRYTREKAAKNKHVCGSALEAARDAAQKKWKEIRGEVMQRHGRST
jgi:hypothetical protein